MVRELVFAAKDGERTEVAYAQLVTLCRRAEDRGWSASAPTFEELAEENGRAVAVVVVGEGGWTDSVAVEAETLLAAAALIDGLDRVRYVGMEEAFDG